MDQADSLSVEPFKPYPTHVGPNTGSLHAWVPFRKASFVKETTVVGPGRLYPETYTSSQAAGRVKR